MDEKQQGGAPRIAGLPSNNLYTNELEGGMYRPIHMLASSRHHDLIRKGSIDSIHAGAGHACIRCHTAFELDHPTTGEKGLELASYLKLSR